MPQFRDRRHPFSRVHFNAPASLRQGELERAAEVLDISLKGALLALPDEQVLTAETPVELTIRLNDEIEIIMLGRVAHRAPGRVGIACESIDLESIQRLRRLIELNLGDSSAMERQLSELIQPSST